MNVVDATTSNEGKVHLLCDDGAVYLQDRPNDIAFQHLAQSARPAFVWERTEGPNVAVPSRVICGVQGQLLVLGDGVLFERVRNTSDPSNAFKPVWVWREVALPGNDPAVLINPPAVLRTEILTITDGGNGPNTTANAKKG